MAKSKNNKNLIIGIVAAVVVVVGIIVAVVVINNNKNGGDGGQGTTTSGDYSSVDVSIQYGDYESMEKLSKDIQNGEATGKVVKVDGLVSRSISSYSIVQENESGSKKIGTQFVIDGASDSDYPSDGDHVVITGKVVEQSPMYFVIKTDLQHVERK